MSVNAELFWQETGTTGYTGHATRVAGTQPDVDFTDVNAARFRVRKPDRTVVYWAADILTDPAATATTISIQHVFEADDFALGPNRTWIELSTDGGTTWYTTRTYETLNGVDT